jgi:hypothetical protein
VVEDPTDVRPPWAADEAAAPGVRDELGRLWRRARRRPVRTLVYALALTAVATVAAALHRPVAVSRVAFRVSGGGPEAPRAGRALHDWVVASVLSDGQLRALVDEHGLYPALAAVEPRRAVEALRDDLEVRLGRDGRTAARLSLTVRGDDPARVYETADHLGRLVEEARLHAHPPKRVAGLRLELVDGGRLDTPLCGHVTFVALSAVLALLLALPLCAVGVAAFDPLVYDLDDVERLGMPTMGAIHGFEGDNAGALVDRLGHGRISPS